MKTAKIVIGIVGIGLALAAFAGAPAKASGEGTSGATTRPAATGMEALKQASAANKYLFIFFSKTDDEKTIGLKKVFEGAMAKVGAKADSISIKASDPNEKEIVAKFDVSKAPMPLAIAIAPNGAVTGGFPGSFDEKSLLDAFGTPAMEKSLQALQTGKVVVLSAQNKATTSNDAAMKAVQDFKADSRFSAITEIVVVDPANAAEAKFMERLKIEPQTKEAVTVLLAPPATILGTFKGAVTKDAIAAPLVAAMSGGCGPGGCGPGGCP